MCVEHNIEKPPMSYEPQEIEDKWRQLWRSLKTYRTPDFSHDQDKFYCLDFFPYPSGAGLSVGHGKNYVPSDVISRFHRMKGEAVLHPMGWDAFGLPAENEAMKVGIHPAQSTVQYAAHYRYQMDLLGCSYDWEREINSSDPTYYTWNQVMFLMLYERGMAYRKNAPVNWCETCQTVLSAEEIENGSCWRCHNPIVIRKRKQWFIKVTAYAEELDAALSELDWPEHITQMQHNWIGRSEGIEITLDVPGVGEITVYTTRIDTLFGVTFVAISPEHPKAAVIATPDNQKQVTDYISQAGQRTTMDRRKHKPDGVSTGRYASLPWGEKVPIYVADYILATHGTGAVMGVPAHDTRDYVFATANHIEVKQVVLPDANATSIMPYTGYGILVKSQQFDGMVSEKAQHAISKWLIAQNCARRTVHFRLRDWLISRQRYWGTPIPIVYCKSCGEVPVPVEQLPVKLPSLPDYQPSGDGRGPLAKAANFLNTKCPQCGLPAQRETDTMTGFVCSSWYYMRFADPHNNQAMFDKDIAARWLPVDMYVGGAEHAVGHLLYSRFWTKFLADAGVVTFREPFPVLRSQGVLHIRNPKTGSIERMSKSKGNVVTPESVIKVYGADVIRLYLLFMGPFEANLVWEVDEDGQTPQHIEGVRRFVNRAWRLVDRSSSVSISPIMTDETALLRAMNATIDKITKQINSMHFNVAISAMMTFSSRLEMYRQKFGDTPAFELCRCQLIKLLAPFAPFVTEEMWQRSGGVGSVHHALWPEPACLPEEYASVEIPVQVNGKVRTHIMVSPDMDITEIQAGALSDKEVQALIGDRPIRNVVVVPQRVVNIVV